MNGGECMNGRKPWMKWVIVSLLIMGIPATADGRDLDAPVRQVWIVSVYGLSLQDLKTVETPHLRRLVEEAAIGAMSAKTAGKGIDSNRYATIGAGTRAVAPPDQSFFHRNEPVAPPQPGGQVTAGTLYQQWTGAIAPERAVIYPGIMAYIRENEAIPYTVAPGALGEALKQAGKRTLVLGNLDEGSMPVRWAPFLTMDRRGMTPEGSIGFETLQEDDRRPYGVKTRYSFLEERLFSWTHPGLAVVELGDLYRLQQASPQMAPKHQEVVKRQIMNEIDRFIGEGMRRLSHDQLLILLVPGSVGEDDGQPSEELLPVLLYGKGEMPGQLMSATTRRTGIVSSIDVAPTVLHRLQVAIPSEMVGQPLYPVEGSLDRFWDTVERVESIYHMRPPVLYSYIIAQMLALVVGLSLIVYRRESARSWMQMILLGLLFAPFLFLLVSGVTARSFWLLSGTVLVGGWLMALLLTRMRTLPLLFWVGLIGFLPVVLDGLTGGKLIQQSFLGYDPIKGARYYGIGNEYMGVVLGSSILMCAAWLERRNADSLAVRMGVGLFFVGLILFFAAPFWGTNAGGALAAMVAFGVAYLRFFHWGPVKWWHLLGSLVMGIAVLLLLNGSFYGAQPSHIGRAWAALASGDVQGIMDIIQRKWQMNWRLVRVSSWGKVFLLSLFAMGVLAFRPVRGLHWMTERYPQLFNGFTAIVAGALAALLLNDSGIVSAATAIMYVVMPVMIIGFREWISHGGTPELEMVRTSKTR